MRLDAVALLSRRRDLQSGRLAAPPTPVHLQSMRNEGRSIRNRRRSVHLETSWIWLAEHRTRLEFRASSLGMASIPCEASFLSSRASCEISGVVFDLFGVVFDLPRVVLDRFEVAFILFRASCMFYRLALIVRRLTTILLEAGFITPRVACESLSPSPDSREPSPV